MRMWSHWVWSSALVVAMAIGCKARDRAPGPAAVESRTPDAGLPDAEPPGPLLVVRREPPIDLHIKRSLESLFPTEDGGVVLAESDGNTVIIRRILPAREVAWEFEIRQTGTPAFSGSLVCEVTAIRSSVWVSLLFDGRIAFGGRSARNVRSTYDHSPDLLFLRLDLDTGKLLAHRQYGKLSRVTATTFASNETDTFAVVGYHDPPPGEPGWEPTHDPPRGGLRILALDDDASIRWHVDSTAADDRSTLTATACCVLLVSTSWDDVEVGARSVSIDRRNGETPWAAVLSAHDGRVLRTEVLNHFVGVGEPAEGLYATAMTDGALLHYALWGGAIDGRRPLIALEQPPGGAYHRAPLTCGDLECGADALTMVGDDVLVSLAGRHRHERRTRFIPTLYSRDGEGRAQTEFMMEGELNDYLDGRMNYHLLQAVRHVPDGLVLFFWHSARAHLVPVDVRVTDDSTMPRDP